MPWLLPPKLVEGRPKLKAEGSAWLLSPKQAAVEGRPKPRVGLAWWLSPKLAVVGGRPNPKVGLAWLLSPKLAVVEGWLKVKAEGLAWLLPKRPPLEAALRPELKPDSKPALKPTPKLSELKEGWAATGERPKLKVE